MILVDLTVDCCLYLFVACLRDIFMGYSWSNGLVDRGGVVAVLVPGT